MSEESEAEVLAKINDLEEWYQMHPQMPRKIDKRILRRFIRVMDDDLEQAKRLLEVHYKMRNQFANIFIERDPLDKGTEQLFKLWDMIPLPGLTKDNCSVAFHRLRDSNTDKFNFTDGAKCLIMMFDTRFICDERISEGEISVIDMNGCTLGHVAKISWRELRIIATLTQDGLPAKIKSVHYLNSPPFMGKLMRVLKWFLKSEIVQSMHFHLSPHETLYEHVPKDMLPFEYGGKAGKLCDLRKFWQQRLKDQRSYLMDPEYWAIDNSKLTESSPSTSSIFNKY
uniref:CRAL-TRIO domain-containing protein n=1 Tax=Glossina austeni TaxID=7395 RepID=A0A1A9VUG1_GLOAU